MAGNDIGNGLMSCGCLIMLIPIIGALLFLLVSFVLAMLGVG